MSKDQMTADQVVQNYLPDYERRKSEFVKQYHHTMGLPAEEGAARFDLEKFPEALAARDAELSRRQRGVMPRDQFVEEVGKIARENLYIHTGALGDIPEIYGYESLEMEAGDLYNRL